MPVFFLIVIIISGALVWLGVNLPVLVLLTGELLRWCKSIAEFCLDYAGFSKVIVLWIVSLLLGTGIVYGIFSAVRRYLKAKTALQRLVLIERHGLLVKIIKDDDIKTAFVHGIFKPKVYVSTGLIKTLAREELKAVILHEAHHRRTKDPLRFFMYALLKDIFYFLPLAGIFARQLVLKREMSADDMALALVKNPFVLAGAILMAAGAKNEGAFGAQNAYLSDECHTVTRVKRIIGEGQDTKRLPLKAGLASLAIVTLLLVALFIPLGDVHAGHDTCDTMHCKTHIKKIGEDCALHCSNKRTV
ncbi:MAG: M56 family metallopeptidase [Deltaproteobacteria bacterium]|nr:M56 family metallopeptidase [Deltaproteobacteria bacterium]